MATSHPPQVSAHPVGPPPQHHPWKTGMDRNLLGLIIFLVSEAALFGSFFMYYGHQRAIRGLEWPPADFHIPADATSLNTLILVLSSFTVELALIGFFRGKRSWLVGWLGVTFVLGAIFLGLQVREYMEVGFTPTTGAWASIFFALTGLHGAHVAVGLLLLGFCIIRAARGHFSPENHPALLGTSIYWHFVDIVWIALYALVYLLPSHVT